MRFTDPLTVPPTGDCPVERFAKAATLLGTPGESYVERRGIPPTLAQQTGLVFDPSWGGRAAVLFAMRDCHDALCAVHGRYLKHFGEQNKMLTVGAPGGAISVLGGWRKDPIVLVEGLFDALTLARCGVPSVATVGRWAPWLPSVCAGKLVYLAFDGNRPGECTALLYQQKLASAITRRLPPPGRSKDWNTAMVKQGRGTVESWLKAHGVPTS